MRKTFKMPVVRQIEELMEHPIEDILTTLYQDNSVKDIGDIVGMSGPSIWRRLNETEIKFRCKAPLVQQIEELFESPIDNVIATLYSEFKSTIKVGRYLGLSYQGVDIRLNNLKIDVKDYRTKEISFERLKNLYEKYHSGKKVGKIVGICAANVGYKLKKAGYKLDDQEAHIKQIEKLIEHPIDDILVTLYSDLESSIKVGEIIGMSDASVSRRLKKAGIQLQNRHIKKDLTSVIRFMLEEGK